MAAVAKAKPFCINRVFFDGRLAETPEKERDCIVQSISFPNENDVNSESLTELAVVFLGDKERDQTRSLKKVRCATTY